MYVILGNSLSVPIKDAFNAAASNGECTILDSSLGKFVSGEAFAEIIPAGSDIKGKPVVVVQSLGSTQEHTANDYAMELLMAVDNLKKNGVGPIWVIAPFLAYARQDRAFGGRMTSVAVDTLGLLLKSAGAAGLSTVEIHSDGALKHLKNSFGESNVFNLDITGIVAEHIRAQHGAEDFVTGGPDKGAHDRARRLGEMLNAGRFSIEKQHISVNETETTGFTGDVDGKTSITVDDMIDTGGTIGNAQEVLVSHGAKKRIVTAPHGVLSGNGLEKLYTRKVGDVFAIDELIISDTIDASDKISALQRQYGDSVRRRVKQISVGGLLVSHVTHDLAAHPSMACA